MIEANPASRTNKPGGGITERLRAHLSAWASSHTVDVTAAHDSEDEGDDRKGRSDDEGEDTADGSPRIKGASLSPPRLKGAPPPLAAVREARELRRQHGLMKTLMDHSSSSGSAVRALPKLRSKAKVSIVEIAGPSSALALPPPPLRTPPLRTPPLSIGFRTAYTARSAPFR